MYSYGNTNKPLEENENRDKNEELKVEEMELEELYKQMPITNETRCGIGCFQGRWLQLMANKKVFIVIYGIAGCLWSASAAYFNGTITTIEKRFKIPSKITGIISVGFDITQLFTSVLISYYGGKGHRPRWLAVGLYCVAAYCFLNAMPHYIYGPGEDALMLTVEYGNASFIHNFISPHSSDHLCLANEKPNCDIEKSNNIVPQMLMFAGQLISGIGGTIYFSVGFSYMDDNIKKSKSPLVISVSYFIRTLGPPIGYALVSACLKLYISPYLTPIIDNKDPRWIGAWWLGWVLLGVIIILTGSILALLPRTLPRAAARKEFFKQIKSKDYKLIETAKPSLTDMVMAFKRIISNKIYLYSHLAIMFYVFGYTPFWMYLPKYIEVEYRQSASASSFATGAVGLVCSALGILASGIYIQKFKPSSRTMAAWNLFIGAVAVGGVFAYAFLGCAEVDMQFNLIQYERFCNALLSRSSNSISNFRKMAAMSRTNLEVCISPRTPNLLQRTNVPQPFVRSYQSTKKGQLPADLSIIHKNVNTSCAANCDCEFSKYSPVCAADGSSTFISACHAGCTLDLRASNGTKIFTNCSCVDPSTYSLFLNDSNFSDVILSAYPAGYPPGGVARSGPCPVDCLYKFYCFLSIVCLLKFFGATGRVINFLISVRCVDEEDKSLSLGIGMAIFSMLIIPAPIVYGYIMDSACLVWGQTCSGSGNCWLYNSEQFRYKVNFTSVVFLGLSTLFDLGVWFVAKTLNIYDEPTPVSPREKYDTVSTNDNERRDIK